MLNRRKLLTTNAIEKSLLNKRKNKLEDGQRLMLECQRHFTCRQVTVWLVHGRRVSASTWAASAYTPATLFLASMQQNIKSSTPLYPWSIWFVNQICFSTGKARHWHSTCPAMTKQQPLFISRWLQEYESHVIFFLWQCQFNNFNCYFPRQQARWGFWPCFYQN